MTTSPWGDTKCPHCQQPVTLRALTSHGSQWACECGRTSYTIVARIASTSAATSSSSLEEGKLDLGPSAAPVLTDDEVGR